MTPRNSGFTPSQLFPSNRILTLLWPRQNLSRSIRSEQLKANAKKIERTEKEKDEAKHEVKVAHLTAVAVGDAKARVEDDLTKALDALVNTEEDKCRLEAKVALLAVE